MVTYLETVGIDISKATADITAYKLKSAGFMDLSVEFWTDEGVINLSVCHYGMQNGDMMRDPEMVFFVKDTAMYEVPASYRNDYVGVNQTAAKFENGQLMINPKLNKQLKSFTKTWVKNLKSQKFEIELEGGEM